MIGSVRISTDSERFARKLCNGNRLTGSERERILETVKLIRKKEASSQKQILNLNLLKNMVRIEKKNRYGSDKCLALGLTPVGVKGVDHNLYCQ